MTFNAVRLALIVPVAALAAAIAPATATAQSDPAPASDTSRVQGYDKCPSGKVCGYSEVKGGGTQWVLDVKRGRWNFPGVAKSVYNRAGQTVRFHKLWRDQSEKPYFDLGPGHRSDYSGGKPMGGEVRSATF